MLNAMFLSKAGKGLIDQVYDAETQKMLNERLHFLDGLYQQDAWNGSPAECPR